MHTAVEQDEEDEQVESEEGDVDDEDKDGDEELTQCAGRCMRVGVRMRFGNGDKSYNAIDDVKKVWIGEKVNVPIDDVKEVLHDSDLLEHKLHFPIHMLLKQMNISSFNN